jgi:DNA-binding transcriptional regulator YdaS (Cro superfamily)
MENTQEILPDWKDLGIQPPELFIKYLPLRLVKGVVNVEFQILPVFIALKALGISNGVLQKITGLSRQAISPWLRGMEPIPAKRREQLECILNGCISALEASLQELPPEKAEHVSAFLDFVRKMQECQRLYDLEHPVRKPGRPRKIRS